MIINMEKIEFLSPLFSGKLEAHLKNGEKVLISRQYVHSLKSKLGIEEGE
jgi:DNA-binding LytR/AlgR family response regulator